MATKKQARKVKTKKARSRPKPVDEFLPYFAKAGHLYIMSELLLQQWNVAMPEVDIGDDIFVVRDKDAGFRKVQVKSANAVSSGGIITATFTLSVKQIFQTGNGTLVYFFLIRHKNEWHKPIIMEKTRLWELYEEATPSAKKRPSSKRPVTITLNITKDAVGNYKWKKVVITSYQDNYQNFKHVNTDIESPLLIQ